MHRLASKAWQGHKGLFGVSTIGKPITFIKRASFFNYIDLIKALCGKMATVAQITFFIYVEHKNEKSVTISPFTYFFHGMANKSIFIYSGERISR